MSRILLIALLAQSPTFHVSRRLIEVHVIVHDRTGKPVSGLTKDQFSVLDQGKAQAIVFFGEQRDSRAVVPQKNVFFNREQTPGGSATVILFDALNTDFNNSAFAQARVAKFLEAVRPEDRVALYGLSNRLVVLHDFTEDAAALKRALDRFRPTPSLTTAATTFKESTADSLFATKENDINQRLSDVYMKARVQQTAAAMEAIASHLARVPGRKNLVWVSGSFPMSIGYFQKRLAGTRPEKFSFGAEVERAARALSNASVAIYPVDAHALTSLGGAYNAATTPKVGPFALQNSVPVPAPVPMADRETMETLADATGGRVFADTNDIAGAVRQAVDDSRFSYTIGYYPDHDQWNGEFREIKVRVKRPGVEVRSRSGYVAFPFAAAAPAVVLTDVALAPLERSELGISIQTEPVGVGQFRAHVRIGTPAMRFELKDGRWNATLEVLWMQLGEGGKVFVSREHKLDFKLSQETYEKAGREGLGISSVETIDEKAEELRFAARDLGSGAAGSVRIAVGGVR
jgi:VWFA-related protein